MLWGVVLSARRVVKVGVDGSGFDTTGTISDDMGVTVSDSQDDQPGAGRRRMWQCGRDDPLVGKHLQGGREAECAGPAALRDRGTMAPENWTRK